MLAANAIQIAVEDTGELHAGVEQDEGVGERDEPWFHGGDGVVALVASLCVVVEDEWLFDWGVSLDCSEGEERGGERTTACPG